MNKNAAKQFILQNARPVDLAVYQYYFENRSNQKVIAELAKYQNKDGGFGNGLEPDFVNPASSPIATNDAIITLYRTGALGKDSDMVKGIVKYLDSHDSFDEDKKRWLFAIDSNKDYPHAIWWEKNENDGISGFNPTMSLAVFMVCYGNERALYKDIMREGMKHLEESEEINGDELKCYLLAYELLRQNNICEVINPEYLAELIRKKIDNVICKETEKYGVEYATAPSDIFPGIYPEFITPKIRPLIEAEKRALGRLQKEDGGYDITWQWYTQYPEFEQARKNWRPRVTLEKLLFYSCEQ